MKKYIVIIENAAKRDILRCMYEACSGVGRFVELTTHSFLVVANTDMVLLRNLFSCSLGPKAKIFITICAESACWTGNMIDSNDIIIKAIE